MTIAHSERDAANLGTPKLHELAKMLGNNGAEIVVVLIKGMLADFMGFTGVEWSPDNVEGILELIKGSHGHLTMAQWKLFFLQAKSGKLAGEGQRGGAAMIARITPMIFMQWLANFTARCEEANELYWATQQRQHNERPVEGDYVDFSEFKKAMASFSEEWDESRKSKVNDEESKQKAENYAKARGFDYEEMKRTVAHLQSKINNEPSKNWNNKR